MKNVFFCLISLFVSQHSFANGEQIQFCIGAYTNWKNYVNAGIINHGCPHDVIQSSKTDLTWLPDFSTIFDDSNLVAESFGTIISNIMYKPAFEAQGNWNAECDRVFK